MKIESALETVGRLDAASKKRYKSYQVELSRGKNGGVFDDRVRDYLTSISKDGGRVISEVNEHLDSNGWNQSTFRPAALVEQAERFAGSHVENRSWRRKFKGVKEQLSKEMSKFRLKTLKYRSNQDVLDALPRLDTHAGWSYITTGLRHKGDYKEDILNNYLLEVQQAKQNNSFNKPILIGYRTQGSVPVDPWDGTWDKVEDWDALKKTRLVSMIDIYQVLAESVFSKPFQRRLSQTDWYMGGKSDTRITMLVADNRTRFQRWYSLDYSKFDQTIPAWLIREAFDLIRDSFDDEQFDEDLFRIIREDFIHKVFCLPDGRLLEAHDGVPSGSMFTQVIDTIVNRLMIDTYMQTIKVDRYAMMIMGDDNLVFCSVPLNTVDIENFLLKQFGIVMNSAKADEGLVKDDPLFLSRFWTEFGAFRHPKVLVAKLLYPERRREYDRHGFTPAMVVESYFQAFRLGMDRFLTKEIHDGFVNEEKKSFSAGKFLTGLAAYQKRYAGELNERAA